MSLTGVLHENKYNAIKYLHKTKQYAIKKLCTAVKVNRAAYYKWLNRKPSKRQLENEELLKLICDLYEEQNGILGYRQMTITVNREYNKQYNHKRIYRLMNIIGMKSVCRKKRKIYIKSTPQVTAENILNRNFYANNINEKWLTDVTEFKYGNSGQKSYLSAILDLADRRIVSYVISRHNDNSLVFDTFDNAIRLYPNAKPIFHSDRGYQYTNKQFKSKLDKQEMIQSMSRVGRCIDNGPMEGFWGMLKSEKYYLHKYETYEELKLAIENYIEFYNNKRYQRRLKCMTPFEYHKYLLAA